MCSSVIVKDTMRFVSTVIFSLLAFEGTFIECRRSGGRSRPSHSRPSSHSSYHSHRPSSSDYPHSSYPSTNPAHKPSSHSSASKPSQSSFLPSPTSHNPASSATRPVYSPPPGGYPSFRPTNTGPGTQRPLGFVTSNSHPSGPIGPPKTVAHVGSSAGGVSTVRPIGFVPPGSPGHSFTGLSSGSHPSQTGTVSSGPNRLATSGSLGNANQPIGPPKIVGTQGNAPYQSHPAGYGPPASPAYHNPAGYGAPPPYNPGYHPGSGYYGSGTYHPAGTSGVTIVNQNINTHNYGGGGYGYGYHYPSYHYTDVDTGNGALGFYLGYSLAKLSTPSYHYHVGYSSYSHAPVYDHYEVHHYYHNSQSVPKQAEIQPNAIVTCVGDSGSFCPANTTSLCTNNGAVMCVASATKTVPCANEAQTNCVKTTVPCANSTAPECTKSSQASTTLNVPCISTAKVYGTLQVVNNTITISNTTVVDTNVTPVNSTGTQNNGSETIGNKTANATNSTGPPQEFCVTILALPAERKLSESEVLFQSTKSIFERFVVKALGID